MVEFKKHTPVEKVDIITTNFMRMWDSCHTSGERKAERMAALLSEFIRVFSKIDPIEIFVFATDEWIMRRSFVPTVAEFNTLLDARFHDWVSQEYLDERSGERDRIKPLDTAVLEQIYPETHQEHDVIMRAIMGHE